MCGIAGILDLSGKNEPDQAAVRRMTAALVHRGPDESGFLAAPGLAIGSRRLAIVGLNNGRQPIFNETKTVAVAANGELFDYPEQKARLQAKGHIFSTDTDIELIVHLYEEHGESLFEHLKGQFAFVLVDFDKRIVLLARDRVGICPLHWARRGDHIYFGSEPKAILASGAVVPEIDPRGLDALFTFFANGPRRTMFQGVESIAPGHYLRIAFEANGKPASVSERCYWDLDFPDWGEEYDPSDPSVLIDEFEATFSRAVEIRLRADVPVVSYLSGGVDSAYVLATASKLRGQAIPSFTIGVPNTDLDETFEARQLASFIGSKQTIVEAGPDVVASNYASLVTAADAPVLDTSCAALLALSREVHSQGYKAVLTGEGADEAFAGYIWFKWREIARALDIGAFKPSTFLSRLVRKRSGPDASLDELRRIDATIGGPHAQSIVYHLVSTGRQRYYSAAFKDRLGDHTAYQDLAINTARIARWHPLNQSLYIGYKTLLAGLLMSQKGDRVTMANSVEGRYPFLDENVIAFASRLHPRWKLRRGTKEKYLLRMAAARILPREVAFRRKAMFRAPLAESFFVTPPPFVRDLMSEQSLRRTGYFDPAAVARDYATFRGGKSDQGQFASLGLTGVMATQLWHHLYLGGGLCDLPSLDFSGKSTERPRVLVA